MESQTVGRNRSGDVGRNRTLQGLGSDSLNFIWKVGANQGKDLKEGVA